MRQFPYRQSRSALVTAFAAVFVAGLVAAPGAVASTLSISNGQLTYTPSSADTAGVQVNFGQPATGSIQVQTSDADPITSAPSPACTGSTTGTASDYVCTGVSALVANGTAFADGIDENGSGVGATPGPVTIPTTLNGLAGDDTLTGGPGDDALNGGPGDDTLVGDGVYGGPLGAVQPSPGAPVSDHDVLNGSDGNDTLYPSSGPNQVSGGAGIDQVIYEDNISNAGGTAIVATPVSVSLDGQANDGYAGNNSNVGTDVEDVSVQDGRNCADAAPTPCSYGAATLTGDNAPNALSGGSGDDTLTGGAGGDYLSGNKGNNTLNGVNGYPDRLDCGGTGTANADQLDTVVSCTAINKTTLSNVGLITQDRAPTVAWTSPKENARVNPSKSNTFQVGATPGTHQITQVAYYVGERTACIAKTAPYRCAYKAKDTDVGKDTLVAIATDSIGLTATKMRTITVTAFKPKKLSASTKPKRIKHAPYRFTTTGRLSLPARVSARRACTGKVSVTFKSGKKKVGGGTATLRRNCTYRSKVTVVFATAHPRTLTVSVAFAGSRMLTKASAKSYKVRVS